MGGLAEEEQPQFQLPVSRTPHPNPICNAAISTNQIQNPKSTNSRDWRKGQTTKGTNIETVSGTQRNYSWDEHMFVSESGPTTSGPHVGDGCQQQLLASLLV